LPLITIAKKKGEEGGLKMFKTSSFDYLAVLKKGWQVTKT